MPATAHQDTTDNGSCRDNYIVGKARRIVVKQSANDTQWARKREGDFNCTTGNMTALRQSISDSEIAQTDLSYDALSRPTVRNTRQAVFLPEIFNIDRHSSGTTSRFAKSVSAYC